MMNEHLPTFIIAGAPKAGSSTIYYLLKSHPQVIMSKTKEPAFFSEKFPHELEWYREQFLDVNDNTKAIGEATVEYMSSPISVENINRLIPNIKLIILLRDPYKRAWSHYWHRIKTGEEKRKADEVFLNPNIEDYPIHYSLYYTHIKNILNTFPKEQLLIIDMDNFNKQITHELTRIFNFLGVDNSFRPILKNQNETTLVKSQVLAYYLKKLKRYLIGIKIPTPIKKILKPIEKKIIHLNKTEKQYPEIPAIYKKNLEHFFEPEMEKLKQLLQNEIHR